MQYILQAAGPLPSCPMCLKPHPGWTAWQPELFFDTIHCQSKLVHQSELERHA